MVSVAKSGWPVIGQRQVSSDVSKLYFWSFRDEGAFHEAVVNRILDDLVSLLHPRRMTVEGEFNIRGGIATTVVATHEA